MAPSAPRRVGVRPLGALVLVLALGALVRPARAAAPAAHRAPPGAHAGPRRARDLLAALERCRLDEDGPCLDRLLAGSELFTRLARRRLRRPGEATDPDVIPAIAADAAAGGRHRYLTLLAGPLRACGRALRLASVHGCRPAGTVHRLPPERDAAGLPPKTRAALAALDRHLGAGLRRRRVRRLMCGPYLDASGHARFAEATVVLADRPDHRPTILDLACRTLAAGGVGRQAPEPLTAVPAAPDSTAVVTAVTRGIRCLEDGGQGCLDAVAPLGRLLHDWLVAALDAGRADREAALDRAQALVAGGPADLAGFFLRQLRARCGDLGALTAGACRAGTAAPALRPRPLPRRAGPSEAARARALEALAGARAPKGPLEVRSLACGALRATVTLVRPPAGPPALVDLTCR